jgi:hypothetical protein
VFSIVTMSRPSMMAMATPVPTPSTASTTKDKRLVVIGAALFAAGMVLAKLLSHRPTHEKERSILPTPQPPPEEKSDPEGA